MVFLQKQYWLLVQRSLEVSSGAGCITSVCSNPSLIKWRRLIGAISWSWCFFYPPPKFFLPASLEQSTEFKIK